MKKIAEIVATPIVSPWKGSNATFLDVKNQIRARWGDAVAEAYSPVTDVAPYLFWASAGFQVKRHERALKSVTFIDAKDENGKPKKIRRVVNLFHKLQLQEVKKI